jgi:hypothetical protein
MGTRITVRAADRSAAKQRQPAAVENTSPLLAGACFEPAAVHLCFDIGATMHMTLEFAGDSSGALCTLASRYVSVLDEEAAHDDPRRPRRGPDRGPAGTA